MNPRLKYEENKIPDFSKTELQIMDLLCREWSQKEIAQSLQLSVGTVKRYKKQLCRKTGSRYFVGVVLFALRNGLVKLNPMK